MVNGIAQIVILISVIATFLAVYSGILALTRRAETLEAKLRRFTALRVPSKPETGKRNLKHLLTLLGRFAPRRWSEGLDLELIRGDIPLKGGEFLVLQGFLMFLFFLIGFMLTQKIYAGFLFSIGGGILPRLWLNSAQKKKRRKFNNQLADALLVLSNSLRAGFSLLQAMEMVSQEMSNPISGEFHFTLREMTYGTSTETALIHLSERVGSDVLDLLVTAMLIQRQAGGNLAEVLQNIHATIQDRLRIQQEIKTLTAQGRMSGYIIAALPFGIAAVLSVLNPSYLSVLFTNRIGWAMLAGGLISQFIGFLIIRKIITIEV
ncbi:type II secretion system F family protein [Desulfosporosinus metallidurans]|uniref:Flp pilus assembly protein TadB n=1 Tax=Desulfosporosinus metallidurans TaxID=1888891 RepID=A0A1Q8R210_9FIRM|nr:type II secretion system F family protein [Desulfosporosinus metallidurans]OLN33636.1 Flp pilus assembly protein TadB [Desulfosporosinus metallidurans]